MFQDKDYVSTLSLDNRILVRVSICSLCDERTRGGQP